MNRRDSHQDMVNNRALTAQLRELARRQRFDVTVLDGARWYDKQPYDDRVIGGHVQVEGRGKVPWQEAPGAIDASDPASEGCLMAALRQVIGDGALHVLRYTSWDRNGQEVRGYTYDVTGDSASYGGENENRTDAVREAFDIVMAELPTQYPPRDRHSSTATPTENEG